MTNEIDLLLLLVLVLGLASLGSSKVNTAVCIVAAQGVAIGALPILSHWGHFSLFLGGLAALTIVLKGVVMPLLLNRSVREARVKREIEPYVGLGPSLVLGAALAGLAFGVASVLRLPGEAHSSLVVPVSLATVFIGMLMLVTRKKAVMQAVGYLVLENGVFVFSLGLANELPVIVEMGVLLDILVGVLIMGIIIFQINREFDHIDANRLAELHDIVDHRHVGNGASHHDSARIAPGIER